MTSRNLKQNLFLMLIFVFSVISLGGSGEFVHTSLRIPHATKIKIVVPIPPKFITTKYLNFLFNLCAENNVPVFLAYKLIDWESSWLQISKNYNLDKQGNVVSIDYGRMQLNSLFIDWMISAFGTPGKKYDVFNNAYDNTEIGIRYLGYLGKRFKGNWKLAVMAYNCGPNAVSSGQIPDKTIEYGNRLVPVDNWWLPPENVELI